MKESNSKTEMKDFSKDPVQVITLDDLSYSYHEIDWNNKCSHPVGMFHDELIKRVIGICDKHEMQHEIKEIFVAYNKNNKMPGVAVSDVLREQYGASAVEAHNFRRVFTTIEINKLGNDEMNTGLAIAYHQDGLQIAIGPNVKICHNQCILSSERMISTYGGDTKIKDMDKIFNVVDDWMFNFEANHAIDVRMIERMKEISCPYNNVMELIGRLSVNRVCHDTSDKKLRELNKGRYPLNASQINTFTENYLKKVIATEKTEMSLWDIYNIATEFYKPGDTDISGIISQNLSMTNFLVENYNL